MQDFLYRGIINQLNIRFSYAYTSNLANEAILKHNCDPASGHILSRCLTAGVLISPLLNKNERLSIKWNYPDGIIKNITIDLGGNGDIRGFIHKKLIINEADNLLALYGEKGSISTIKSNQDKVNYTATTEVFLHNPIQDLAFYYSISEKIETEIHAVIGFNSNPKNPVKTCQGFLLQALPGCDLKIFSQLRKKIESEKFYNLLKVQPTCDNYFEQLLNLLIIDKNNKITYSLQEKPKPKFKCYCSKSKMILAANALPKNKLEEHLTKQIPLNITCNFCSERYRIPQKIITQLIKNKHQD